MIFSEFCQNQAGQPVRPCALIRMTGVTIPDNFITELQKLAEVHVRTDNNTSMLDVIGEENADADTFFSNLLSAVDRLNACGGIDDLAELIETKLVSANPNDVDGLVRLTPRIAVIYDDVKTTGATPTGISIHLDPGHVFGTGLHPSTRLAVSAIEELYEENDCFPPKVLDVGTGSGILAVVCAALGAEEVLGVDVSHEAIAIAEKNVMRNNFARRVRISAAPIPEITEQFDLVVANVTASVLLRLIEYFPRLLSSGGCLVVSGFQRRQADELRDKFLGYGFKTDNSYEEDSWRAMRFHLVK